MIRGKLGDNGRRRNIGRARQLFKAAIRRKLHPDPRAWPPPSGGSHPSRKKNARFCRALLLHAALCRMTMYPQGESNPCSPAENRLSWATRRWGRRGASHPGTEDYGGDFGIGQGLAAVAVPPRAKRSGGSHRRGAFFTTPMARTAPLPEIGFSAGLLGVSSGPTRLRIGWVVKGLPPDGMRGQGAGWGKDFLARRGFFGMGLGRAIVERVEPARYAGRLDLLGAYLGVPLAYLSVP